MIVATVPNMPLTTLSVREYDRVEALMKYKTGGGDVWERYLSQDLSLTIAERNQVSAVGTEWMADYWVQFSSNRSFDLTQ